MKILYVEDELPHVELAQRTLEENLRGDFALLHCESLQSALDLIQKESDIDIVLTDLRLPDGSGLDLLKKVRELTSPPAVVLVTGQGDEQVAVTALKAGASDYLVKQNDYLNRLPVVITNAVAQNNLAKEQAALREVEHRFRVLVEQLPAAVYTDNVDEFSSALYISPHIEDIAGYTAEEWLADPKLWMERVHPDDRERVTKGIKTTNQSLADFNMDYRLIHRDGRIVWVRDYSKLILDEHGKPKYWQGILFDVTKEVEAQESIQRERDFALQVLNNMGQGLTVVDQDGRFEYVNPAYANMLGRLVEEIVGRSPSDFTADAGQSNALDERNRRSMGIASTYESMLIHQDGHEVPVIITGVPRRQNDGINGAIAVITDLTAQKQTEQELERQVRELTALHAVASAEAEGRTEDDIISNVTLAVSKIYPDVCGVLLLDSTGTLLTPHLSYTGADISDWLAGYPITDGITGRSVSTGKIIRTGDITKEPDYIPITDEIQSELSIPIRVHEHVIGVINIESRDAEAFTKHDEDFLATIASGLGNALERLRLLEEEQKRARELNTLYMATKSFAESLEPDVIANELLKTMDELLGYEFASIYLTDDQQQVIAPLAISPKAQNLEIYEEEMAQLYTETRPLGMGIIGWVAEHGLPIRTGDVSKDERYLPVIKNTQSELCVPMVTRGRVIGAINLDSTKPNDYTERDEYLLTALANSAAIALENARLYEAESERRQQAENLQAVTAVLSTTLDMDVLYQIVLDSLKKLVSHDSASITLEWSPEEAKIVATRGFDPNLHVTGKIFKKTIIWGELVSTRKALIMDDAQVDPRFEKWEETQDIHGWLVVPMISQEMVLGFINLDSHHSNAFTERDATIIQTFANSVAVAIQNSHLFESEKSRRQEAESLRQAASIISSTLDPDTVADEILTALQKIIPYESGSVFLYENDVLRIAKSRGYPHDAQLKDLVFPSDDEFFQEVRATGQVIIIRDAQQDQRFKHWGAAAHIRGWMVVPLISRGRVLGVITLDSKKPGTFNETMGSTALAFAHQAAAAIDNARLYEETQNRLNDLEIINRVSAALREAQSPDEMLPTLLDETLALAGTAHGSIWLYDQTNLRQQTARGTEQQLKHKILKPGDGIVGHVFNSGKNYITTDLKNDLLLFAGNRESIPTGAGAVCIPIKSTVGPVGALMVLTEANQRINQELNLLTILAEITGNSIHRAELYEQSQEQVRRLTTLRDIDAAIASSTDLRVTMSIIMEHTLRHLKADAVNVMLYHPELQNLTHLGSSGFSIPSPSRPLLRLDEGLAGQVVTNGEIVHIRDLNKSNEAKRDPILVREKFLDYYGIPLIVKGQIKGVFEIYYRTAFIPTTDWTQFLHMLAGQAAIAIDNAQLFDNLQRSYQEITQAYDTTLEGWARALELRDRETEGHTRRVTELTLQLARYMSIPEDELVNIYRGVLLHDIGKMGVPDQILRKTGPLDDSEWTEMRKHPEYAFQLLSPIPYLRPALDIPYCHHEHWDGSGYPRGLKGEQIPLSARIFSIVDIWDALLSNRPYRNAWPRAKVVQYIKDVSGTILDPGVVTTFLGMIAE